MAVAEQLDPTSLVARIIAELQANPDAQRLLLRALLTNEFLGMPARLDRIDKDIAELKADVRELKADVRQLKVDVGQLKGSDLEHRLHRKIRSVTSQALLLRRARVVQGPLQEPLPEFAEQVEDALDHGRISSDQEGRIDATDFILRAERRADRARVWVALEVANKVGADDIERAGATALALRAVFGDAALPVVAGYGIDPLDAKRAEAAGVRYLEVSPPRAA